MILNANSFQSLLNASIQNDIVSSMNPKIQALHDAIPVIERYIQAIPFSNTHTPNYSINAYADYQTVREHFCSFWKRELGLSHTDTIELGKVFDHALTTMPPFPDNSPYIILNEQRAISVSKMEDAIFDALDLMHLK